MACNNMCYLVKEGMPFFYFFKTAILKCKVTYQILFNILAYIESKWERTKKKIQENPLVVPAVGVTLYALGRMGYALFKNDHVSFQKSQRLRIGKCFFET